MNGILDKKWEVVVMGNGSVFIGSSDDKQVRIHSDVVCNELNLAHHIVNLHNRYLEQKLFADSVNKSLKVGK